MKQQQQQPPPPQQQQCSDAAAGGSNSLAAVLSRSSSTTTTSSSRCSRCSSSWQMQLAGLLPSFGLLQEGELPDELVSQLVGYYTAYVQHQLQHSNGALAAEHSSSKSTSSDLLDEVEDELRYRQACAASTLPCSTSALNRCNASVNTVMLAAHRTVQQLQQQQQQQLPQQPPQQQLSDAVLLGLCEAARLVGSSARTHIIADEMMQAHLGKAARSNGPGAAAGTSNKSLNSDALLGGLKGLFAVKAGSSSGSGGGHNSSENSAEVAQAGNHRPGSSGAETGADNGDAAAGDTAQGASVTVQDTAVASPAFEARVQEKFWSTVSAYYPETLEATPEELAAIQRLGLHLHRNGDGWNALHYAAAGHKVKLVQQLLDLGADPGSGDAQYGLTPLHLACMGRVKGREQLRRLMKSCASLYKLQAYAIRAGPACRALVQLLLDRQVDTTSPVDSSSSRWDEQAGLTPLHLLACFNLWAAVKAEFSSSSSSSSNSSSIAGDKATAAAWLQAAVEAQQWAVQELVEPQGGSGSGADVNARTVHCGETPLTFAAFAGAYEVAELLLEAAADPNLPRLVDAVRPLDMAVAFGHPQLACLLLERGAEAVPSAAHLEWARTSTEPAPADLQPHLLLPNAVESSGTQHSVRLVELLLQRGAPLEEVNVRGETALLAAVVYGKTEIVRLLVAAGANLETTRPTSSSTPLVDAAIAGQMDIMQVLLDAGADCSSYVSESTGYDLVQTAANCGQFEAVVKLVEAGASWRLARGQPRVVGGCVFYVPEILSIQKANLKLSFIEGRLKLAEKVAKQKKDKVASPAAGAFSSSFRSSSTQSPGSKAAGGASDQQQPAAVLGDIDALAAEIEALGNSSSSSVPSAPTSKKSKKKKMEKERKQRAKQKQQQQQQRSTEVSDGSEEEEQVEPAVSSAGVGAGSADELSELLGDVSLEALQKMAGPASTAAHLQQGLATQQQPQQAAAIAHNRKLKEPAEELLAHASALLCSSLLQAPAAAALTSLRAAPPGDAQQAAMQQAAMQQTATPWAAAQPASGAQLAAAPGTSAGANQLAAAGAAHVANQTAALLPLPAAAGSHSPSPTAASASPAAAASHASTPGPAAAPSVLQNWRGSLNPIFMYNRPGSSGGSNALAAATSGAAVAAAAVLPSPTQPEVLGGTGAAAGLVSVWPPSPQGVVQQQVANSTAGHHFDNARQQQQQQQRWRQQVLPAIPAKPSAVMAALQVAQQGSTPLQLLPHQQQQQQHGQQGQLHHVGHSQRPATPPAAAGSGAATAHSRSLGQAAAEDAGSSAAGSVSRAQTRKQCIVCMERLRDVLLLPCKHLVLCSSCADQMDGRGALGSCPYCRQPCAKLVRVHQ